MKITFRWLTVLVKAVISLVTNPKQKVTDVVIEEVKEELESNINKSEVKKDD